MQYIQVIILYRKQIKYKIDFKKMFMDRVLVEQSQKKTFFHFDPIYTPYQMVLYTGLLNCSSYCK